MVTFWTYADESGTTLISKNLQTMSAAAER